MAGFFYFFRGRNPDDVARGEDLNHNLLAECGLAEVLADVRKVPKHASVYRIGSNAGPGKSCGTMLAVGSKYTGCSFVGNDPAVQQFVPINEEQGVWIGVLKNELPRPEDLERFHIIPGGRVVDPQHHEWRVPVARSVREGMPYGLLPQGYRFNLQGEPQPVLDSSYEWLWNLANEVMDYYRDSEAGIPRDRLWLVKTAGRLLAVNYRLGPHELNLLYDHGRTILHQQTIDAIAQASYGWAIEDEAKKNEPETAEQTAPK